MRRIGSTHRDLRQRSCSLNDADGKERYDARLKFGRRNHVLFLEKNLDMFSCEKWHIQRRRALVQRL